METGMDTASPSQFIDTRFSTLNFRLQIDMSTAPSSAIPSVQLRSHANSFFDRQYTVAQNGKNNIAVVLPKVRQVECY